MFTDKVFDQAVQAPHPTVNLSGTLVETYFSPDGGTAAKVLDVLNAAQASIQFMAFAFTRADFADALVAKAQAGVSVQGVFESRQVAAGADLAWNTLQAAGVDVRQDGNPYVLHHKVFIVDRQIVVLGSYNFSRNAEEFNAENLLIIHNAEIAQAYLREWEKVWERAGK
jgi:phosphatidylserine/phosphatidylglycerophosphate/cardiolipin synthase-like enzyme